MHSELTQLETVEHKTSGIVVQNASGVTIARRMRDIAWPCNKRAFTEAHLAEMKRLVYLYTIPSTITQC